MKVEVIDKNNLLIYINNVFFKKDIWDDREKIVQQIKTFIVKIKNNYKIRLRGFYKVRVFPNKKIGTFIEMEKIDEEDYDSIELRIIVDFDEPIYFIFDNYEDVPNNTNYIYYKDYYYVNINNTSEDILSFVEKGKVTYKKAISDILWLGKNYKK